MHVNEKAIKAPVLFLAICISASLVHGKGIEILTDAKTAVIFLPHPIRSNHTRNAAWTLQKYIKDSTTCSRNRGRS